MCLSMSASNLNCAGTRRLRQSVCFCSSELQVHRRVLFCDVEINAQTPSKRRESTSCAVFAFRDVGKISTNVASSRRFGVLCFSCAKLTCCGSDRSRLHLSSRHSSLHISCLLYRSGVIDLSRLRSWSLPQKYYKETCSEDYF